MSKICVKCLELGVFRKHSRICNVCKNKQSSDYKKRNRNAILKYNKDYKVKNTLETANYNQNYRKNNKESIRAYKNKYEFEKRRADPTYKLRQNLSSQINGMLKSKGGCKQSNSILQYLPYTIGELRKHLERQFSYWMSWDNHGLYKPESWDDNDPSTWTWQIDHIVPQSKLSYSSMLDDNFRICWSLDNLRPLSAKQNSIDGGTRVRH